MLLKFADQTWKSCCIAKKWVAVSQCASKMNKNCLKHAKSNREEHLIKNPSKRCQFFCAGASQVPLAIWSINYSSVFCLRCRDTAHTHCVYKCRRRTHYKNHTFWHRLICREPAFRLRSSLINGDTPSIVSPQMIDDPDRVSIFRCIVSATVAYMGFDADGIGVTRLFAIIIGGLFRQNHLYFCSLRSFPAWFMTTEQLEKKLYRRINENIVKLSMKDSDSHN